MPNDNVKALVNEGQTQSVR